MVPNHDGAENVGTDLKRYANAFFKGTLDIVGAITARSTVAINGILSLLLPPALDRTITVIGTTGSVTIDKMAGTVNIAAGAATATVTNALVGVDSIVLAVIRTGDATAILKNVVPGVGSFVVNTTAVTTAATSVGWVVLN